MSCHGVNLVEINVGLIFLIKTSKCIFNLSVVISLHDDPAHHVQEVRKLQITRNVRVDLDGEILQLLLGRINPEVSQEVSQLFGGHQPWLSLIKPTERLHKLQNVRLAGKYQRISSNRTVWQCEVMTWEGRDETCLRDLLLLLIVSPGLGSALDCHFSGKNPSSAILSTESSHGDGRPEQAGDERTLTRLLIT